MQVKATVNVEFVADDREIREFVDGRIDQVARNGIEAFADAVGDLVHSPGVSGAVAQVLSQLAPLMQAQAKRGAHVNCGGPGPRMPAGQSCTCPAGPPGHVHLSDGPGPEDAPARKPGDPITPPWPGDGAPPDAQAPGAQASGASPEEK